MNKNEIKKEILKQKPTAFLTYIRKGSAYYICHVKLEDYESISVQINFEIPVSDMGDADFGTTMEAKLLNRWIILPDNDQN